MLTNYLPNSTYGAVSRPRLSQRLHIDMPLLLLLLLISGSGLLVLYSAGERNLDIVYRQLIRLGLAFVLALLIAQVNPRHYQRWAPWLYFLGVILLLGVIFLGSHSMGAKRWLQLPGLPRFQPAELMKLVMPMMIACYFANKSLPPTLKNVIIVLLLILLPTLLIAKQPDLGTALLVAGSGIFVLFLAGLRWRFIGLFVIVVALAAPLLWYFMHDYQRQRVLTFIDPLRDPLGAGWNIIQSQTAIGSGGIYGKGWLNGTQSHLDFLPESSTDFIVAVAGEEFGLIGLSLLLILYLLVIVRGLYIAVKAQDTFTRLLAGSLVLTFFVYVFVNVGMVTGLLPVVGIPLPLISYGGTSLVTLMIGFGMLMSIHTHRKLMPG
jgi:rod shape determining protein RodA